jgi:hypothetical protein
MGVKIAEASLIILGILAFLQSFKVIKLFDTNAAFNYLGVSDKSIFFSGILAAIIIASISIIAVVYYAKIKLKKGQVEEYSDAWKILEKLYSLFGKIYSSIVKLAVAIAIIFAILLFSMLINLKPDFLNAEFAIGIFCIVFALFKEKEFKIPTIKENLS